MITISEFQREYLGLTGTVLVPGSILVRVKLERIDRRASRHFFFRVQRTIKGILDVIHWKLIFQAQADHCI